MQDLGPVPPNPDPWHMATCRPGEASVLRLGWKCLESPGQGALTPGPTTWDPGAFSAACWGSGASVRRLLDGHFTARTQRPSQREVSVPWLRTQGAGRARACSCDLTPQPGLYHRILSSKHLAPR